MRENTVGQDPEEKVIPSACRLCYGRCGILGHVKNGRIVKIEGNPTNPYSKGTICQKAISIPQLVHHPGTAPRNIVTSFIRVVPRMMESSTSTTRLPSSMPATALCLTLTPKCRIDWAGSMKVRRM